MLYWFGRRFSLLRRSFGADQEIVDFHGLSSGRSSSRSRLTNHQAENNPQFTRSGGYLMAQLLQSIHGFSSGSKRLFELSESNRGSLVNNARNLGLFQMHQFGDRRPAEGTLAHQWEQWINSERLRRTAWAIYVSACHVS